MSDKRIVVWVQLFADRPYLMLQWYDPLTGKRKSKSAETCNPLEAERKRADLEYELNHGLQEASKISWKAFRERFENEHVAACRQNTKENYKAAFDIFERLCSPVSLRAVTAQTLSHFAAALRQTRGRARDSQGQAPATIRQRLQLLRKALGWALDQKLLVELPKFPSIKVPRRKPQPIPPESFERLLAKAPDQEMRTYLLTGWLGGLRLGEAAELEWEPTDKAPYVDLDRDRIVLPADFVKAAEDQWVPLDPVLREALVALPRQGKKVFRFVSRRDGHPVGLSAIGERVIRLAKKAGVRLTMHSLRKGFGCRYAGKVPAQVLQKLMRHSNISLTMTYYANVDDAAMKAVLGDSGNTGGQRNTSRNSQPTEQQPTAEQTAQSEESQEA